ncbi:MAG: right-handed parallel beta-helix repeat-containing protein [Candidatus Lokiarchaeota archaeon]|nr:right-handed parallel beta-helix repeat-containing protein [Candidatus Lokiarchaeota archaeon]
MKKRYNTRIGVFLLLVPLFACLAVYQIPRMEPEGSSPAEGVSTIPVLPSSPHSRIQITGMNWSNAVAQGICTGNGTAASPYLIKDFEIDGGGQNTTITVTDSNAHFIITNCTLYNVGSLDSHQAGILLINASNGVLFNNTVETSNPGNYGIHLANSSNANTIANNSVSGLDIGIYMSYNCSDNTLANNTASYSASYGIYDQGSTTAGLNYRNTFVNNMVKYNADSGIFLYRSNNFMLLGNDVFNNTGEGIELGYAIGGKIVGNLVHNNTVHGVYTIGTSNVYIAGNNLTNNEFAGLGIWQYTNYIMARDNNISANAWAGIFLAGGSHSTITRNVVLDNVEEGISVNFGGGASYARNNTIYKNYVGGSNRNAYEQNQYTAAGNKWNLSTAGNYWADYGGVDGDGDGCGDTLYNVTGLASAADFKPIVGQVFHDGAGILIDGDGTNGVTWEYAASRFWCDGLGTQAEPYVIANLTINAQNATEGIYVESSSAFFKVVNCTIYNASGLGSYKAGIELYQAHNGALLNNKVINNGYTGFTNVYGILIFIGNNGTVEGNFINKNTYSGVSALSSDYLVVKNNTILDNGLRGLNLQSCDFALISGNIIENQTKDSGMTVTGMVNSTIANNTIRNNGDPGPAGHHGLDMRDTYWSNITGNVFERNDLYQIRLWLNTVNNTFWLNRILRTRVGSQLVDETNSNNINNWNCSWIGNEWYGFAPGDDDDDGIGDIPLVVSGAGPGIDYLPIYDDGFNGTAIFIDDLSAHDWEWAETRVWCEGSGTLIDPYVIAGLTIDCGGSGSGIYINNSRAYFCIESNTIIHAGGLEIPVYHGGIKLGNASNGIVAGNSVYNGAGAGIHLHAGSNNNSIDLNVLYNNTHGIEMAIDCDGNVIYRNRINESTSIGLAIEDASCQNNLMYGNEFHSNALNALDEGQGNSWDDGTAGNYWDDYGGKDINDDGIGDTYYNVLGSANANDTRPAWWDAPLVAIIVPVVDDVIPAIAPAFNISVIEGQGHSMWHTVDTTGLNSTAIPLAGGLPPEENVTGTIDQTIWDAVANGTVVIRFFVNDSKGWISSQAVTAKKDVYAPRLLINAPMNNTLWDSAPQIDVSAIEPHLDELWYRVYSAGTGWSASFPLVNATGQPLDPSTWSGLGEEAFEVHIYANDTVGNLNGTLVLDLTKDTVAPSVSISAPANLTSWSTPPLVNVSAWDLHGVDTVWYQVGGTSIVLGNGVEEPLDPGIWTVLPDETMFFVFIRANDTVGNLNDAFVLSLVKDTTAPEILAATPLDLAPWASAPDITATAWDPYIDAFWYRVFSASTGWSASVPLANATPQALDASIWNGLDQGDFEVHIYANDTAGNLNATVVLGAIKDTITPAVTIITPPDLTVWNGAPSLSATAEEQFLDSFWYRVYSGSIGWSVSIPLANTTAQPLDASIWSNLGEEAFEVHVYANDTAGNLNGTLVLSLTKDTTAPSLIVNTPPDLSAWSTPPPVNVSASDLHGIGTVWYQVGGTNVTVGNGVQVPLDAAIWGLLPDEAPFTVNFYANDTVGNLNNIFSVSLVKDTRAPAVVIVAPLNSTTYAVAPSVNVTALEPFLGQLWYRVYSTSTGWSASVPLVNSTAQPLDASIWSGLDEENFEVNVYANDTAGNLNGPLVLSLTKDTVAPSVSISAPANLTSWPIPPSINISALDLHGIGTVWYQVGGTNITVVNGVQVPLDAAIWGSLPDEAPFTINLYANDTVGNLNSTFLLSLVKDTSHPTIAINDPMTGTILGKAAPYFDLTISDPYLDKTWYQVINQNGSTASSNVTFNPVIDHHILQGIWDFAMDGGITIVFHANDTAGNSWHAEVNVTKDAYDPVIGITTPLPGAHFASTAPPFNITVVDARLHTTWYTLNGGAANTTFTGNGSVAPGIWSALVDGGYTLHFYANDSGGNVGQASVMIFKDTANPVIGVVSPHTNDKFSTAPLFEISVVEANVDATWYSLYDGTSWSTNVSFGGLTGEIDRGLWDAMPLGAITIRFYIRDEAGTEAYTEVIIEKNSAGPDGRGLGDQEILLIVVLVAAGIVAVAMIGAASARSSRKAKKIIQEKEAELAALKSQKEEITEGDITISKEMHTCLVHKGPIKGYSYICPTCGAYYCAKCIAAIIEIENTCWSCKAPLDMTRDVPSPATEGTEGDKADEKKQIDEHESNKKAPKAQ